MAGGREEWAFTNAVIPPEAMARDVSSVCYNRESFFGFSMLHWSYLETSIFINSVAFTPKVK